MPLTVEAPDDAPAHEALHGRLRLAAALLGVPQDGLPPGAPERAAARLLDRLARQVQSSGDEGQLWLLLALVHGNLPVERDLLAVRRRLELDEPQLAARWLLDAAAMATADGRPSSVEVVSDRLLVDAGHTAGSDLNTGIQRVVRETVRRWAARDAALPVAWTPDLRAVRTLTAAELGRVAHWGERLEAPLRAAPPRLVVPWRTTVLLPEVPSDPDRLDRLAALGRWSGNRLVVLGHDVIPLTTADLVPLDVVRSFTGYLAAVASADHVVAVSRTSADAFAAVARARSEQGLPAYRVSVCPLAHEVPTGPAPSAPAGEHDLPLVLCAGTVDRRKNQIAVLHAAEVLWREGERFRLVLMGHSGLGSDEVSRRADRLAAAGWPVEVRGDVTDEALWEAVRAARFTVFPTLYEGYGLPVAESLAAGTPVITSAQGSTAESAADGGALLVDPRDDQALVDAVRRLLQDDALLARLRAAAAARPGRTWSDYADELLALVLDDGAA